MDYVFFVYFTIFSIRQKLKSLEKHSWFRFVQSGRLNWQLTSKPQKSYTCMRNYMN